MIIQEKDKRILEFFGITEENIQLRRLELFSEIDEIVTYGEGYDWNTVYNFPIWLRKFTYKRIIERYKKKSEQIDDQNGIITNETATKKMSQPPQVNNSYTTHIKASNK